MALYEALAAAGIGRVAIVDDDSGALAFASLTEELRALLSDPDDERFEALLGFAHSHGDIPAWQDLSPEDQIELTRSLGFVRALCRDELSTALPELHAQYMQAVLLEHNTRRAPVVALSETLRAIGYPEGEITLFGADVTPPALVDYPLVFVDLMLDPQAGTSQRSQDLIAGLAQLCRDTDRPNPLLVVMSINETMLRETRRKVRAGAQISASGFRVLPKTWISGNSARQIVELVLTQLLRERALVPDFRKFVVAWQDSITAARDSFVERLWSLDMRSLQILDEVAQVEGMALEDHLGDVLMRFLLWHVESQPGLQPAMSSVNQVLRGLLDATNAPTLVQDMFDAQQIEALNRAAIWHGRDWLRDPVALVPTADAIKWLKRHLSFGDVVVSSAFPQDARVWIHLTQACDFARVDGASTQKLLFLQGNAELESAKNKPNDKGALTSVRGCRVMDQTYTLFLDLRQAQLVAPSLASKLLANKKYRVSSRMRPDAAQRLLNDYAKHISRVAMPGEATVQPIAARMLKKEDKTWTLHAIDGQAEFFGAIVSHDTKRSISFFEPFASRMATIAAPSVQSQEGTTAPPAPALTWLEYLVSCFRDGLTVTSSGAASLPATKAVLVTPESNESLADAVAWAKNRGGSAIVLYRERPEET